MLKFTEGHLQHFLDGNENKICSKIVCDINKLQLEPKIRYDAVADPGFFNGGWPIQSATKLYFNT